MSRRGNDVTVVPVHSSIEPSSPPPLVSNDLVSNDTPQHSRTTYSVSSSVGWNVFYVWKTLLRGWFRRMICEELSLGFRWRVAPSRSTEEPVVVVEDDSAEFDTAGTDYTVFQNMEFMSAHLCWLRGVVAYISLLVYLLGFFYSSSRMWTLFFRIVIFLLSETACVFICKSYAVRLRLEATTDSLYGTMRLLSSPLLPLLILEVLFWNLITPPMVFRTETPASLGFGFLNYLLFTRLYAVIAYYWHVSCGFRSFDRFMGLLGSRRQMGLGTRYYISTTMVYHRRFLLPFLSFFWWITVGLLFCKAERELSISDGLWVSFQTLSTLSYGDISPTSVHGKWLMWIAWLGNALLWGYLGVVIIIMPAMSESQSHLTENVSAVQVEVLSTCYLLSRSVRERSACVIQAAWRLHVAKRTLKEEGRVRWRRGGSGERSSQWNLHLPALLKHGRNSIVSVILTWKLVYRLFLLRRDRHALYQNSEKLVDPSEERRSEKKKRKTIPKKQVNVISSDSPSTGKFSTEDTSTGISLFAAIECVRSALCKREVEASKMEMFEALARELLNDKTEEREATVTDPCISMGVYFDAPSVEERIASIESKNAELKLLVQQLLASRKK